MFIPLLTATKTRFPTKILLFNARLFGAFFLFIITLYNAKLASIRNRNKP